MGIMQLINIILFGLFFGFLSFHIAKKKGRPSPLWFACGLALGIFGLLLVILLPKKKRMPTLKQASFSPPVRSDAWIKMWYYLDPASGQQGPHDFPDIIKKWKAKNLSEKSYIWGEGMKEWKQLGELPELVAEMQQN